MATRETLISDLPPPQSGGGEQNLVQNIIQEYETVSSQPSGGGGGGAPIEHFQSGGRSMGGVQNPVSQNELVSHDQFTDMQRSSQQQQLPPPPLGGNQQQMPPLRESTGAENFQNSHQQYADDVEYYEEIPDEQIPLTTSQIIYYHVRLPVLVAVLVYLSNMRMINLYMIKYIPKMANRLGGLSQLGMVFKSLLFAVVFYLVATFLLK